MVNDCGFLEKRVSFWGKIRSKLGRDLQTALWHLMVCELITCPKLPSKLSLFGKFHLCSKNSRARQGREKMMVSVVRLARLPCRLVIWKGFRRCVMRYGNVCHFS